MNAQKTFILFLALAATAISAVEARAAVGTNKANGIYTGGGWTSQRVAGSQTGYRNRAPATYYRAPAVQGATAPALALAPTEGRRFSYDPSSAATTVAPCDHGSTTANAPVVNDDRRFSYAPTAESTVAPAATRTYAPRQSYSGRSGSSTSVNRWALQKSDSRKFND